MGYQDSGLISKWGITIKVTMSAVSQAGTQPDVGLDVVQDVNLTTTFTVTFFISALKLHFMSELIVVFDALTALLNNSQLIMGFETLRESGTSIEEGIAETRTLQTP